MKSWKWRCSNELSSNGKKYCMTSQPCRLLLLLQSLYILYHTHAKQQSGSPRLHRKVDFEYVVRKLPVQGIFCLSSFFLFFTWRFLLFMLRFFSDVCFNNTLQPAMRSYLSKCVIGVAERDRMGNYHWKMFYCVL